MRPGYKNWMPKGMVLGTAAGAAACLLLAALFGCTGILESGTLKTALTAAFLVLGILVGLAALWMALLYRAFSYNGKRQMQRRPGHRLCQAQPPGPLRGHRSLGQGVRLL